MQTAQTKTAAHDENLTLDSKTSGGAGKFGALLLKGAGKPATGVVMLHGRVGGPDGPVVGWLRKSLNAAGYTTVSLERPAPTAGNEFPDFAADVTGPNTLFPEAGARIKAAIAELKKRGCTAAVVCGFSMGARMTSAFLATDGKAALPIKGFLSIGIGTNGPGPLNATTTLGKVKVPVIDICGDGDGDVTTTAPQRVDVYKAGGGPGYESVVLPGNIPHPLTGAEAAAEKAMLAWLKKHAPVS